MDVLRFLLAASVVGAIPIGYLPWLSDSYWPLTLKSDFLIWLMLQMMTAGKNTLVSGAVVVSKKISQIRH